MISGREFIILSILFLLAFIVIKATYFVNESQTKSNISFSSSSYIEPETAEKPNQDRVFPSRINQKPTSISLSTPTAVYENKEANTSKNGVLNPVQEKHSVRLFLGIGYNYVDYQENFSWVDVRYRDLSGPSFHIGAEFEVAEGWEVNGTFKDTPLSFQSVDPTYGDIDSHWKTLALQVEHTHKSEFYANINNLSLSSMLGLQVHETPMVIFNSASGQPQVVDLQLVNASLGIKAKYLFSSKLEGEILMRFQYPLTYGSGSFSNTEVRPILFYDGSVGVNSRIAERSFLGLYWFGQSLNMDINITSPGFNINGSHNVLFSNMELRYTYEF